MSRNPQITVPLSRTDMYLEVFAVCAVVFWWIYTITSYRTLPDTIPIHYNLQGQIDGYGHKATMFIVPSIITLVMLFLTFISRIPHLFNYPAKITHQNAAYQYRLAARLLRFIKLVIVALGIYITFTMVNSAHSGKSSMHFLFIPLLLLLIFVPTGIYLWKAAKNNKTPSA